MKLLDVKGRVTPEDSRTHIRVPFELDKGIEKIYFRFEYTPKDLEDRDKALELLEDSYERYILPEQKAQAVAQADRHLPLKNLITLSLDDTRGYRGACHRHDPVQELYLGEHEASPGLTVGELLPGSWSVTLSLHCIVTDSCEYRLQIRTSKEEDAR